MDKIMKKQLIDHLAQFITPSRREKIDSVVRDRTRHIVPVLEDVYQPHNISAALRSVECFGVQDTYVIEQQNRYTVNTSVSKGASNWLSIKRFGAADRNNTEDCFKVLRANGYRIAVTSVHPNSKKLSAVPLDQKIALVFGTEERGVSLFAQDHADLLVTVPMCGFTESLNVSVCVALCLNELTTKLRASPINWRLSEEEQLDVKLGWLRMLVRGSELMEKEFRGAMLK